MLSKLKSVFTFSRRKVAPAPPPQPSSAPKSENREEIPIKMGGITGMDMSLPIYDGTSENNTDHLIELEDDSMETAPDVRAYFWELGRMQRGHKYKDQPLELEERKLYDSELVREGRTFLRSARQRGAGYYLNKDRSLLAHNKPGDPWYCMPAASAVLAFDDPDALPIQDDEGCFFNGEEDWETVYVDYKVILTNVRAPFIFAKYLAGEFKPGTIAWDDLILGLYTHLHPVQQARAGREPYEVIGDLRLWPDRSTDPKAVRAMIDNYWPPPPPSPILPPVNLMKLTGSGKPKDFFKSAYKPRNAASKRMKKKLGLL